MKAGDQLLNAEEVAAGDACKAGRRSRVTWKLLNGRLIDIQPAAKEANGFVVACRQRLQVRRILLLDHVLRGFLAWASEEWYGDDVWILDAEKGDRVFCYFSA